jgi:hypothetical protein
MLNVDPPDYAGGEAKTARDDVIDALTIKISQKSLGVKQWLS